MSDQQNHDGLALLLQASRDFALKQLAEGRRLIPFAARASSDGSIDFVRLVDEDSDIPLDTIHQQTQAAISAQAQAEGLEAAAIIAAVGGGEDELGAGFDSAIRVDIEAPGFARIILTPYRFQADAEGVGQLVLGEMQTYGAEPAIFPR